MIRLWVIYCQVICTLALMGTYMVCPLIVEQISEKVLSRMKSSEKVLRKLSIE
jgi:hypothetical protein